MERKRDAGDLDRELKRQGIPIVGVSCGKSKPEGNGVEVQYPKSAAKDERKRGDAIAAAYDWNAPAED